jgi:hypothetical protein
LVISDAMYLPQNFATSPPPASGEGTESKGVAQKKVGVRTSGNAAVWLKNKRGLQERTVAIKDPKYCHFCIPSDLCFRDVRVLLSPAEHQAR